MDHPLALTLALLVSLCLLTEGGLAPSLKPMPSSTKTALDPDAIVHFTKNLYKELGNNWGNTTVVAEKYRDRFQRLNETTQGQLGDTLASLFEIRMLDLQASVRHARKMRAVIEALGEKTVDPVDI
jgi:predicted metalloendopeptidase